MKRFLRTAALVSFFSALLVSGASAQLKILKATSPEERAQAQTRYMERKLQLSPPQLQKITSLNLWAARKAEPILKGSGNRFTIAFGLRSIQSERNEKLEKLLSAQQLKILRDSRDEMKKSVLERLGQGMGKARGN